MAEHRGDEMLRKEFKGVAIFLFWISGIINVLDPDVIVLGGGVSRLEWLYEAVPRLWLPHVFSDEVRTRLVPAVHGDSSGVRGAAWLWPAP